MPYKDPAARKAYAKKYYAVYNKTEKHRRWMAAWKRKQRATDGGRSYQAIQAWRKANPERLKGYNRRAYERQMADPELKEKRRQLAIRYRLQNPEKVRSMWQRWKTKDPEYAKLLDRISHSKRYNAPGECSPVQ